MHVVIACVQAAGTWAVDESLFYSHPLLFPPSPRSLWFGGGGVSRRVTANPADAL